MSFQGFTPYDFDTFAIDGLEGRMAAIQERIQPKFKALGDSLCEDLSLLSGTEMFLHIAKHARRKVNPPVDTWLAIGPNKRGYKQLPHFQVGLFDDRVFIWFALIYELPNKANIASSYLNALDRIQSEIPKDLVLSFDHMRKDTVAIAELDLARWTDALTRFRDVKKVELLIGRNLASDNPILGQPAELEKLIRTTFEQLMPFYQMAMNTNS